MLPENQTKRQEGDRVKIAGLDIGTTGCKITVFDENGQRLLKEYRDYPVSRKHHEHEIDIAGVRDSVLAVVKSMTESCPDIGGIGVTSFGETFVVTDEEGTPLFPSMLYTDPRGQKECDILKEKIGEERLAEISGLVPHEMYSIAKIMWVFRNRPDVCEKAAHIFLIEDYIVYLLTGVCQIDYSLAARTMAFDIRALDWSQEILEAAGVRKELFSKPVPTGTIAGEPLDEICRQTGLSSQTKIVSVSHDQVAAAVGAGVFDETKAVDGAGTVECMTCVLSEIPKNPEFYKGKYAVTPYIVPGKYLCYAFSYTGGALLQWFLETFAGDELKKAKEENVSAYDVMEAGYSGPTGLLVLPHFAGAATPYMDTESKGAILGLTMETEKKEIYWACMEGVAYEMRLNEEILRSAGISFSMLHATGGGASSEVWTQIKADVLNVPIKVLEAKDAGTVGSAMITGTAVGYFQDLKEAAKCMIREKGICYPDAGRHEAYEKIFQRYRHLYEAVRPLVG